MEEFIHISIISFQCLKLQSNLMYQNVMYSSLEMEEILGLLVEVCNLKSCYDNLRQNVCRKRNKGQLVTLYMLQAQIWAKQKFPLHAVGRDIG